MSFTFAPLKKRSFDLVMIDCPWPWRNWTEKPNARSPDAQYETASMEWIAGLPVRDLLTPIGAVCMWCTWPMIDRQALILRNGWGLDIVTGGAWAKRTVNGKLRYGLGHVLRSTTEPFLIGAIRGHKLKAGTETHTLIETIENEAGLIDGLAREHSRKPEEAYRLVERLMPHARKADIFTRQRRRGWASWGKEIDKFPAVT